jgi:hypothetical protein
VFNAMPTSIVTSTPGMIFGTDRNDVTRHRSTAVFVSTKWQGMRSTSRITALDTTMAIAACTSAHTSRVITGPITRMVTIYMFMIPIVQL